MRWRSAQRYHYLNGKYSSFSFAYFLLCVGSERSPSQNRHRAWCSWRHVEIAGWYGWLSTESCVGFFTDSNPRAMTTPSKLPPLWLRVRFWIFLIFISLSLPHRKWDVVMAGWGTLSFPQGSQALIQPLAKFGREVTRRFVLILRYFLSSFLHFDFIFY